MSAAKMLAVSLLGYARLTPLSSAPHGSTVLEVSEQTGPVVHAMVVNGVDDIVVTTRKGRTTRVEVWSGAAQRRLLDIDPDDAVAGVERIPDPDGVLGDVGATWQ